jgi:hypothetical protein
VIKKKGFENRVFETRGGGKMSVCRTLIIIMVRACNEISPVLEDFFHLALLTATVIFRTRSLCKI